MRDEPQPFKTVSGLGRAELEIKRSRFLALAAPSADETTARALIAGERERYPDANHHTFAYRLGHRGDISRFSDDGEPGGTAGRPMMEVLLRETLVDVVVVVTRYFGGTLLGAGGLTRAYGKAATEAIHASGFRRLRPHTLMHAVVAYPLAGAVEQGLTRAGLTVRDIQYTDTVSLSVPVPASEEAAFTRLVADLTSGTGHVEARERLYLPE